MRLRLKPRLATRATPTLTPGRGIYLGNASHRCASHGRLPCGRVICRRAPSESGRRHLNLSLGRIEMPYVQEKNTGQSTTQIPAPFLSPIVSPSCPPFFNMGNQRRVMVMSHNPSLWCSSTSFLERPSKISYDNIAIFFDGMYCGIPVSVDRDVISFTPDLSLLGKCKQLLLSLFRYSV